MYYTKTLKITSGGARNILPLAYERPAPDNTNERVKNREKQGIFAKNGIFLAILHNSD